ncbi:hypothetical protein TVAG_419300 [Trichomonas vaginalis G3]|uniref:Uncharacterized protein n=1 Tax=Trichomonas vaginalis (strain ATCC PRA-98 / G3) TaxID=412133 RepID=A2GFV9_TRIV3|nr:hypothetical protein TVAGG3_0690230 [Trichomonas vaginalis G3]XP_001330541.2 hypothetical protein TVAGG3_0041720 [Trichomonas vaginalis G3]XP_051075651.1 uncharacterized protein TVAGG3_1094600 [Trichomonas vaginalis G3]EAX75961.1 hypothetical protein TVAG_370650 [Trichomonas vaginalis G3]EAX82623.1 hypothetical protein TVAG_256920 [Trichomonas vaginalis G3]EAX83960.1 hypothetical protein TVAG_419300 [Trichomonas vaginalis G3]KAI5482057.1 hypothetical protein TVAGG3_1094600 [Trichomonas vag|eukprot:XP_001288891.1 hypothetical protein [Trichomonas vaginalis G3]
MTTKVTEAMKQKFLVEYIKSGAVPEGFYVHTMKDGRVQFRKIKQPLDKEGILRKIKLHEDNIAELKKKLEELEKADDSEE